MSNFRQRAREVKAAGVEARGDFTPHGAPKRVYDYWLRNTTSKKGTAIATGARRENFCHYWRVVVLWAPLLFLFNKYEENESLVLGGLFFAMIVALVVSWFVFDGVFLGTLFVLACIAVLLAVVAGVLGGAALLTAPADRSLYSLPTGFWMWAAVVVGLPSALITVTLGLIGKAWNRYAKGWAEDNPLPMFGIIMSTLLTFWFLFIGFTEGFGFALLILGILAAIIVGGSIAAVGLMTLADHVAGKRRLAAKRAAESAPVAPDDSTKPREPSKVDNFFRGVGDFLVFLAQVVRVNKWKICPLVEVNEKEKQDKS